MYSEIETPFVDVSYRKVLLHRTVLSKLRSYCIIVSMQSRVIPVKLATRFRNSQIPMIIHTVITPRSGRMCNLNLDYSFTFCATLYVRVQLPHVCRHEELYSYFIMP